VTCYDWAVQGDAFGFMKLSALIITELKNLSAASRMMQQQPPPTASPAPVNQQSAKVAP
jgi:hypothetical protein